MQGLRADYRRARAHTAPGGLVTNYVCNPAASAIAAAGIRLRWHPSVVSLGNPAAAAVAAIPVVILSTEAQSGWIPGWLAVVFWPLAYILDCADGQLARATGKKSEYGARVDVLADYLAQVAVVAGLIAVVAATTDIPAAALSAISALWFFGTVAATLRKSDVATDHSLLQRQSIVSETARLVADTGFVNLLAGGWLLVSPSTVWVPAAFFSLVSLAYLAGSLLREFTLSVGVRSHLE
jgi:phosphatidylglycerophosphate synthase